MRQLIRTVFLLAFCFLAVAGIAYACSCFLHPKFSEMARGNTVIRGSVESFGRKPIDEENAYPMLTVSISEVINGTFPYEKVELLGDPGWECLASMDPNVFAVGSEFLFVLGSEDFQQGLGGCAETYVKIDGDAIRGEYLREAKWWRKAKWVEYSVDYSEYIRGLTE